MVVSPQSVRAPSILVVEDNQDSACALSEMLKGAGYNIYCVDSGEAALEEYAAHQPDLVLLDVGLPGIDGIETCRRLHLQHGEGCAPIMLMSGGMDLAADSTGFPAGAVDFLAKPFASRDALVHIRAHLESRRYATHQKALVAELSRVSAAKDSLLGMCAHDLRNPLSSVSGLAEFLLDPSIGPLNSEQLEIVMSIREATQSMLNLVNELLDISIIEAGKVQLKLAPASLREMAERSIFLASILAARKGTQIVLQPETSPDFELMMDVTRIREVVDNLISNAVKYSPPGSCVEVTIGPEPATRDAEACVRFAVRDRGPGIPENERNLLFREFSRLSACPTGGEKSTGLGLAICRKIIDAHGGKIGAVNHPEGGCVFSFTLPISPCNPPDTFSSSTTSLTSATSSLSS